MDCYIIFLGCLACLMFMYVLYLVLFKRIMFDRMLIHGSSFMLKIAFLVISTPFLLTFLIQVNNIFVHDNYKVYSAKELVYTPNLYGDNGDNLSQHIIDSQEPPTLFWSVYYHFVDPGNQHMTTTKGGRVWSVIISMIGAFLLNGLLISTMVGYLESRKERWLSGKIRYSKKQFLFKKFAVVIGANEMVPLIIRNLLCGNGREDNYYVVLLTNDDVEKVRSVLESYLSKKEERRLIIYNGQLDSIEEISCLHLENATEICILGEDSREDISESYHDVQNMRIVHNVTSYLTDRCVDRVITCRVMFEYQTTYSVFQFSDLHENIRHHLLFMPFNPYENWAQRVLVYGHYEESVKKILPKLAKIDLADTLHNKIVYPLYRLLQRSFDKNNDDIRVFDYLPLDGKEGISAQSNKYVHFVVIGMSKMGIAMAIQAAQVAHYPNFKLVDEKGEIVKEPLRTRITFIDKNADREMHFFKGRFQNLFALSRCRYIDATKEDCNLDEEWVDALTAEGSEYSMHGANFLDVEWEFIKGSVELPMVAKYLKNAAFDSKPSEKPSSLLTLAVCEQQAHKAIAAGIYMPAEVYDHAQQILVYQREASDIVYNLISDKTGAHKRYAKLRPFGMQYADFAFERDADLCAQLCNYIYTIINDAALHERIAHIGRTDYGEDFTEVIDEWNKLPIFHKWSNKYLSNSFDTKIRSVCGNMDRTPLPYETLLNAFEENKDDMARCEHNRWNMQQLLMGFRAFNNSELEDFYKQVERNPANKDAVVKSIKNAKKNSSERVHLDICSFEQLLRVDAKTQVYDENFNSAIPAILKRIEMHTKLNS